MVLIRLTYAALIILAYLVVTVYAVDQKIQPEAEFIGLSIGTGFEFETGDYGTNQTIDSWRIPFRIAWSPSNRWGVSLEIPYIYQSGSGETVLLGGQASPTGRGGRMTMTSASTTRMTTFSEQGLGDSTLNIDFSLVGDGWQTPKLMALGYAKLPTADKDKGLGTGEFDG